MHSCVKKPVQNEVASLAGDEVALARVQISESTEPIVLDLKQPIRMTERLRSPGESHGLVCEGLLLQG
jgi:hypothetical protein